jgi:hypothetical protein
MPLYYPCIIVENASASLDAHACDSRVSHDQSLINPSYRVFALANSKGCEPKCRTNKTHYWVALERYRHRRRACEARLAAMLHGNRTWMFTSHTSAHRRGRCPQTCDDGRTMETDGKPSTDMAGRIIGARSDLVRNRQCTSCRSCSSRGIICGTRGQCHSHCARTGSGCPQRGAEGDASFSERVGGTLWVL